MALARDYSHYVKELDTGVAHLDLAVEGMTCAACMTKIERGLSAIPDVTRARVNLTDRRLAVEWRKGTVDPAALIDRLAELGYKAYPFEPVRAELVEAEESRFLLRCLGVAAFAAMNVMMLSIPVWSGNVSDMLPEQRDFFHWMSALVVLPAATYAGRPFFQSAWRALRAGGVNMDVPISIGVIVALAMSVVETIHHAEHAYFDAAVMLLTFLLAGRYLDQNMRRRTRAVAGNLAALKAETAAKFVGPEEISEVPAASIRAGDIVLLRPGERSAVDGEVIEGRSEIDQSLITGETRHVPAEKGTPVYAGTMNVSGALRVRVAAAAEGTLLAEITRLLDNALQARSRYVQLADRASRLYAPAVHSLAALTFAGWMLAGAGVHQSLIYAIAVLIITCPCALGLAVPVAQVVACSALMRRGVMVKDGAALERIAEVNRALLDKTGTLTLGRPLPDPAAIDALPADAAAVALGLASHSRHPLSRALVEALGAKGCKPAELAEVAEEPGQGVSALWQGRKVALRRPEAASGIATTLDIEGQPAWLLPFADRLRPDARASLEQLRALGIEPSILSGDNPAAVAEVARETGLTGQGGASPQAKQEAIARLQGAGHKVLMAGDGLNDGPALAAANASIAPGTASDVGRQAADLVFLGDSLEAVPMAVRAARRTMRVVRQNFVMAIGYNLLAVPLAMAGLVTPLIAAVAMSTSSLLVIGNSLRLARAAK